MYFVLVTSTLSIMGSLILIFQKYDYTTGRLNISVIDNIIIWFMYLYRNGIYVSISVLFVKVFFFFFRIKKAKLAKEGR